ncbi:hypothetical protein EAW52_10940 [Pseudomonas sp. LTJR-52]|uniref:HNH endonuclease n=1 Tax=Pseudomonas sp. LTJR-52 TaxID=2479392 RepID=UPI000EFB032A|nr:HNH endonuclease [Pseudomonas sp. LTJR-52]AYN94438.1 hypothetical protein EAW52_10940 [Pseudomonas sp. LTJR-52]
MSINEASLRDRVLEIFHIDLDTGTFIRKSDICNRKAGEIAGTVRPDGYRQISIDNKTYLEHQLIMLVSLGYLPELIDHLNGDKADNRLENLRPATSCLNARNQRLSAANKSGATGVRYRASRDAYEAYWDLGHGVKKHKCFRCDKYASPDEALNEAIRYRKAMIDALNEKGAGYTDRHGSSRA